MFAMRLTELLHKTQHHPLFKQVALIVAYILLAHALPSQFGSPSSPTLAWLPSGLAVTALFLSGAQYGAGVFVGYCLSQLLLEADIKETIILAGGYTLEALLASKLLSVTGFQGQFSRQQDYFKLLLVALLAPLATVLAHSLALLLSDKQNLSELMPALGQRWQSDLLGILLLTPVLLIWRQPPRHANYRPRLPEVAALLLLVSLAGKMVFFHDFDPAKLGLAWAYGLLGFVIWAATRFDRLLCSLVTGHLSLLALIGTAKGGGVFAAAAPDYLWFYLLTLNLFSAWLSIQIDSLRESASRFKSLAESQKNQIRSLETLVESFENNDQAIANQISQFLNQKRYLDAIMGTAEIGIIGIDCRGIIQVFNRQAELIFGYNSHEVEKRNVKILMPPSFAERHDGFIDAYLNTRVPHIIGMGREVLGLRKNGEQFPLKLRVCEIEQQSNGAQFVGFIQDISKLKHQQQELEKSENRYRTVADDQPNLLCRYRPDFTLTFVNKAYCATFKHSEQELLGQSALAFVPPSGIEWFKVSHAALSPESPVMQHESKVIYQDGREDWQSWNTRAIFDADGKLFEYQGVGTITTERKQTELALIKAKQEAEQASQAKSQFLSNMSHELRTPLNSIIGFSQLLESDPDEPLSDMQQDSVSHILKAGNHLLTLINEILDLSRIESGNLNLSMEDVNINDVLGEVIPLMSSMADSRQVSVQAASLADDSAIIHADYVRLKQIIINLLSNAIKYNYERGSVTIKVSDTGPNLQIAISDTGPGIPADKMAELFKPFSRLGAETTAIEGTGIGLCITKSLAKAMGGGIQVSSEPGQGCCFSLHFPKKKPALQQLDIAQASMLHPTPFQSASEAPANPIVSDIVYIEDNQTNLTLMRKIFGRYSHLRLHEAKTGNDGLKLIQDIRPAVVLLDIDLPDMNGFEVLQQLRASAWFAPNTPVIAVSANAMQHEIKRGLESGFFDYITKPLNIAEFMQVLDNALEKNINAGENAS